MLVVHDVHKLSQLVRELDPVCHQLYEFYRSKEEKLQLFALQFAPTLVWLYLRCLSRNEKKNCGGVETFLLGVYNLEIVKPDGTPVVENIRVPTISRASIYHESRIPGVTEPLTEHALRSLNNSHSLWKSGPYPQHERFNAQNRFSILSYVMQHYNRHVDSYHSLSLQALCSAIIKLNETGFAKRGITSSTQEPRIALFPSLLVEFMMATYFAMFNGHKKLALEAVKETHNRASYELYSDVLLITNAMLNSYHRGNFKFDNHGVTVETQKQKTVYAAKHSITNASFKAKKLPDDIDIVEEDENQKLSTVEEDQEHTQAKGIKAKLMNKLGVDKNKNRETARRNSDTPSMKSTSGSDLVETLGVGVKTTSSGGKIMVDHLEMQPLKIKGGSGSGDDGSDREKNTEGRHSKISASPTIFSKKFTFSKNSSGSESPGKGNNPSISASQLSVNGQSSKGSSPLSKNSLEANSSPRAQSEGPNSSDSFKLSSMSPPLSSPSILSSSSSPYQKDSDATDYSNTSEPTLTRFSSSFDQPSPSPSSVSVPAENSDRPAQLHINRNSFSTTL
ncbi:hyccin-like isoform X3 [Physella acuta]|uniref:hyccin-like isoform X3 n=1 Tax=Physella acuta TaxID=109671 RepID=UPI0027DB094B|nr:hyccin-like isoform X3 [Physella acuta]